MAAAARVLIRLRYLVAAVWLAGAVLAVVQLPAISEVRAGALGAFVPDETETERAERISAARFRFPVVSRVVLVEHDQDGLSAASRLRTLRRAIAVTLREGRGAPAVAGAIPVPAALGRSDTTSLTYLYFRPGLDADEREAAARGLLRRGVEGRRGGWALLTGAIPARAAEVETIMDRLPWLELATGLLVVLVIGLHFRAPGAALLTLGCVLLAYLVATRALAWLGQSTGIAVPREVEPVIVVLIFGIVTDYAVFYLSRFRAGLRRGDSPRDAATAATAELTPIVMTAGLIVIAASLSLVVAKLDFLTAFGPTMAAAVVVAVATATTLVPALLAIGGRAVFWPRAGQGEPEEPAGAGWRGGLVRLAVHRPWLVLVLCLAVLGTAAAGVFQVRLANPLLVGLPDGTPPKRAYLAAAGPFPRGVVAPTLVVVRGDRLAAKRDALLRLERALARQPGVAATLGPADQPFTGLRGVAVSTGGDASRYVLVLSSNPFGADAMEQIATLRERLPGLLRSAGLEQAEALVGGSSALTEETIDRVLRDLARTAPVAFAAVLALLALFLRSLRAALLLVAASALGVAAAVGLSAWFFLGLLEQDGLVYFAPLAATVLLLALGADYTVFLAGTVWREAGRRQAFGEAIRVGGARAATPITVAGLVLAGSFGLLALVSLRSFEQMAFMLATGIVIDAFLVRALLVPALLSLAADD